MIKKYKGGDPRQAYQGDVSLIKILKSDVEVEFSPLPQEGIVIAEGEATGHKHVLVADRKAVIEIAKDPNGYFINVKNGTATIRHEEHEAQVIKQGLHFFGRQWEYSDLDDRKVTD